MCCVAIVGSGAALLAYHTLIGTPKKKEADGCQESKHCKGTREHTFVRANVSLTCSSRRPKIRPSSFMDIALSLWGGLTLWWDFYPAL